MPGTSLSARGGSPRLCGHGILVEETGSKRGSKQMLSTGVVCHTEENCKVGGRWPGQASLRR